MVNRKDLDQIYKEFLAEDIIAYLADIRHITLRQAMDIFYRSKLSAQITAGVYGIENLDYRYLAEDLIEMRLLYIFQRYRHQAENLIDLVD